MDLPETKSKVRPKKKFAWPGFSPRPIDMMWAAITSHAHIWGFHGNVHIAWGFYYTGITILHLIPCSLLLMKVYLYDLSRTQIMPVPCLSSLELSMFQLQAV